MEKKLFRINQIPALLWGRPSERVILAIHGSLSHKADAPIQLLAAAAIPRGYQVLSFDLPEHGDRREEKTLCMVQPCVEELNAVMGYAKARWQHFSLFANSIGAYFSLLAYQGEPLERALFLSPLVDMERMIGNMMCWFSVSEERLRVEGAIPTPMGQTLYWEDYRYVKEHPVSAWSAPTHILYGAKDTVCERDTIEAFTQRFHCGLTVIPEAEHYFHTPDQLEALSAWLAITLEHS